MENLRLNALALHLGVDADELNICSYDDQIVEYGNEEYLVVTDDEANDLWDAYLENYIDRIFILPQLPEQYRFYFDREAWKSDAKQGGRAHSLNRYDGSEDEITVYQFDTIDGDIYQENGEPYKNSEGYEEDYTETETFYIYRQN